MTMISMNNELFSYWLPVLLWLSLCHVAYRLSLKLWVH